MSYMQGNLISNDQLEDVETGARPSSLADYKRLTRLIPTNTQKVVFKVKEINEFVEKLGTNEDSSRLRDKLHDLEHATNQLCRDTSKQLKDVNNLTPAETQSERRERRVRIDRLTKEFEAALSSFQDAQNQAATKEKEAVARIRALSTVSIEESSQLPVGYSQGNVQLQQLTDVDLDELKEREAALQKLEGDIMDVNQIFKDLASMVEGQGEMIDSIEAHVTKGEIHIEKGKKQLEGAVENKKKAREKKFICAGIIAVIAIIIIIVIVVAVETS